MPELAQAIAQIQELQDQSAQEKVEALRRVSKNHCIGEYKEKVSAARDYNRRAGEANAYARVLELLKGVGGGA